MGQPITTALGTTAGAIQDLRLFADALKDVVWTETVGGAEVHKVAAGVVGVIDAAILAPLRRFDLVQPAPAEEKPGFKGRTVALGKECGGHHRLFTAGSRGIAIFSEGQLA